MSKRIIIYGGRSVLGDCCVKYFLSKKWWVGNIDYKANENASLNIVPKCNHWTDQENEIVRSLGADLQGSKLDAIVCVVGGYKSGNCNNNLSRSADKMWKRSVWSSTIAASLAAKYLNIGGLLVLTGSKPALEPTPQAIGYGMAKAAVHHLTSSLACQKSGLPEKASVIAILPETMDFEFNKQTDSDADADAETPLNNIVKLIHDWSNGIDKPASGSLVSIITNEKKTVLRRYQIETVKSICE